MKNLINYVCLFFAALILVACKPVEDRDLIGDSITADQLNVTATPLVVDGKKTNKVVLENHSPVLSLWDYGTGKSRKQSDTVLMVMNGEQDIYFTGFNPNGTTVEKKLEIVVEELKFPVAPEYAFLCGTGTKSWKWRETARAWGNGGFRADSGPAWWSLMVGELDGTLIRGEGKGSQFSLALRGSVLTKKRNDGTVLTGKFEIDLNSKLNHTSNTRLWSLGMLKTTISVPGGVYYKPDKKEAKEFHIVQLTNDLLVLAVAPPGISAGQECWFSVFVPAE
ncbi:hypothetical protein [Desertivirga xinjiangensis]|uniref:hypothetical protein n=1 Tax=Desertivirga xinjiangensis TaxID=539206 RepID=UPI00210DBB7B|nr:hypothetical protein [Pedobacter xinjiangensis]